MKILIDQNVPLAEQLFGSHGELIYVDGRDIGKKEISEAKALICRSVTAVGAALLGDSSIEFVGSCTIGTDHLDTGYLESSNIQWTHAPGCNAQSVVEYVTSALAATNSLKLGLKAAIIGCGSVGSRVYSELQAFGISVVGYDPLLQADPAKDSFLDLVSLEAAMSSDIVCLHTPYTESGAFPTADMIGENLLALLRPNAILVSAGRGGVVQESAMRSIAEKRPDIRWALDVWMGEPFIDSKTLDISTIATPHIAGYSLEGRQNGSKQVYKTFCEYFGFTPVDNCDYRQAKSDAVLTGCSIEEILLAVYDPREDDKKLRAAQSSTAVKGTSSGTWFDRLRKEYPSRRERSAYRLSSADLSSSDMSLAAALGFEAEEGSG